MRPKPLALVWTSGDKVRVRSPSVPLGQTLLGKSVLQLTLEAVAGLKPRQILVADCSGGQKGNHPSIPPGVRWLPIEAKKRGCRAAILAACDVLGKQPSDDLIVLDGRLSLVRPRTLRLLLRAHVKGRYSLTKAAGVGEPSLFVARVSDFRRACSGPRFRKMTLGGIGDLIRLLEGEGTRTGYCLAGRPEELLAVRTPQAVSMAVAFLRRKKMDELESKGVAILNREATWVDLGVRIGRGTVVYPSVVLEGSTTIGRECRVYPFVHLVDAHVGDRVKLLSSVMIEESRVGNDARVGPFTHFRPGTIIRAGARVGNFVEMKNTVFGRRSKAGHLSYLGDAVIEEGVNVGAGTITCNYDGFKKSRTVIERDAFIGSGTELVAPVRIGRRAYIGAGSVITRDVPPEALAVARGRQVQKLGWVKRKKSK
jgi:bifunctional UDP-N-acetylglucosamine pyrophosphorylase/glucosamine-1-phosphate N-acetyltransferase